jgi:hypothetical protein
MEHEEVLHDRRKQDQDDLDESFRQCPAFLSHSDVKIIHTDLQEIKITVGEMRDIVVAWQDAKSFFRIIKIIGEVIKWVVAVGIALGLVWFFVTGRDKK